MLAKDLMTAEVLVLSPDVTVGEALETLVKSGISGAPVVEKDGRIYGMLTEEDLLLFYEYPEECHLDQPIRKAKVLGADLVTRGLISVRPDTPLDEVATLLIGRKIKRVAVVENGKIVGILSRRDLLKGLLAMRPKTGS